ncbi:aminoglycoside N(3)-acetyltransferase [Actinoplanes regularis]|uniref:Aminoglycoside N(3)-acetyltransferase n=1 Tax=Actinoplanes regularis TaxID=52697 RepID=A0A239B9X2_9ACTN|nr:AAC(3) family N-acetyltransferase [Actinoplanes regularis]GIE87814.1 AAC(3) family N-acetyltransferase [Actinoplanes regularis]SNS03903.1 aminoglycoside 3-N-acetyltransferase [Actinoplanes regularis]
MIDLARLVGDLRALEIPRGGVVLVHCGMRRIGRVGGGAATLLRALRAVLGDAGTVVVPAQTPGNSLTSRTYRTATAGMTAAERDRYEAAMPGFDRGTTPSYGMGVLAETVRRHRAARRSAHPQTSFAAVGPAADEIVGVHDLDCHLGERSPLGTLYRLGATLLMIGVEMDTCTALHLAEYRLATPPPLMTFSCFVTENGQRQRRQFEAPMLDDTDFRALGNDLLERPWTRHGLIGAAHARVLPMVTAVDHAVGWLERNRRRASIVGI